MRMILTKGLAPRVALAVTLVVGSVVLVSAPQPAFTTRDKAYYADEKLVNFVRPGLVVTITSAEILTDGTIRTKFKLADPRGLGLDREGITTPGPVTISFICAYIPKGQTQYVSYTTRVQTSPITNVAATQAAGQNNGTFDRIGDGEYQYTFSIKAPATIDRTTTHTIGAYASRNLTEFDLGIDRDDATFNFVPDGSRVTLVRDVIRTGTCNQCHDPLALHGGSRRSMELCVLCHTPQTVDPDTGNTADMPVMIHKIHMGADLPSVRAGGKYVIIGNQQSVHDYSTVGFPADVRVSGTTRVGRNCVICHQQGPAGPNQATQATNYLKANRAACGACHDNVKFQTGENHVDLPQFTDNQCTTCHVPQEEYDFDASIMGAHLVPRFSSQLPGTVLELVRVDDGAAGKRPTVTFRVKDKSGRPIPLNQMNSLALVLAGPTSDYASYVSEDPRAAGGTGDGTYFWTMAASIPANAKGSYSIGISGYRNVTLLEGTRRQTVVRDAGVNKVIHFSVDGSPVAQRRTVVSLAKCNTCHYSLDLHGSNRNQIEFCVFCHNPNQDDRSRRPAAQMPAQTVDFRHMIHRIHTGEENDREYTVYGFGNTPHDYTEVRFPGDRRNCDKCHVNGSQLLPLRENLLPVSNPRGWLNPTLPEAAACLGCHTGRAAASHALANTTTLGESCSACHGQGYQFDVNRVHAR